MNGYFWRTKKERRNGMNVTWRKAKAVLAVPLALCLTMTGVNQTAFAEEAGTGDTVGTGG